MAFATRLNVVTLGVRDILAMRAFYTHLGLVEAAIGGHDSVYLMGEGIVVALYPMDELAVAAADVSPPRQLDGAFSEVALAVRVSSDDLVDAGCELVRQAGGTVLSEPAVALWGSRHAYFADPEGNVWQLVCTPQILDQFMALVARPAGGE
ncbi:MAG: hypothetical protein GX537_06060 [Actinobacteria bacterium]|jgi:hypothetical protein|nr:hypothetical protein [Actinomycetota bacterium]